MNIYVGNMSYETSEEDLREAFIKYGEVTSVNVITDRDTGRPRGFAFVEMADDGTAQKAIDGMNNTEISGRALNVSQAKPRNDRSGGGGGGRRGW